MFVIWATLDIYICCLLSLYFTVDAEMSFFSPSKKNDVPPAEIVITTLTDVFDANALHHSCANLLSALLACDDEVLVEPGARIILCMTV